MNATANDTLTERVLHLNGEELGTLIELLESTYTKLLIEIRHTDHRSFRDQLRHRQAVVEALLARCRSMG